MPRLRGPGISRIFEVVSSDRLKARTCSADRSGCSILTARLPGCVGSGLLPRWVFIFREKLFSDFPFLLYFAQTVSWVATGYLWKVNRLTFYGHELNNLLKCKSSRSSSVEGWCGRIGGCVLTWFSSYLGGKTKPERLGFRTLGT